MSGKIEIPLYRNAKFIDLNYFLKMSEQKNAGKNVVNENGP